MGAEQGQFNCIRQVASIFTPLSPRVSALSQTVSRSVRCIRSKSISPYGKGRREGNIRVFVCLRGPPKSSIRWVHMGANRRIRLKDPCSAAMRAVAIVTAATCYSIPSRVRLDLRLRGFSICRSTENVSIQEGLAVASIARDDPTTLPGMHRDHNALPSQTDGQTDISARCIYYISR